MTNRNLKPMKMEIKFYMNFHIKDGLGVDFIACNCELMQDGALTSTYPYRRNSLFAHSN